MKIVSIFWIHDNFGIPIENFVFISFEPLFSLRSDHCPPDSYQWFRLISSSLRLFFSLMQQRISIGFNIKCPLKSINCSDCCLQLEVQIQMCSFQRKWRDHRLPVDTSNFPRLQSCARLSLLLTFFFVTFLIFTCQRVTDFRALFFRASIFRHVPSKK